MEVTPELAELLGAYVGDGSMSRLTNGVVLMSIYASKEERDWLEHLATLFEKTFCYRPKVRWCTTEYALRTGAREICKFFQSTGFPVGKKTFTVRTPQVVMNTGNAVVGAFLRGYFDADGSLSFQRRKCGGYCEFKRTYHYYPRLSLESASKELIHVDIKSMLDSANFRCRIYNRKRLEGRYLSYTAVIKGSVQLDLWMKEIGPSNPVHFTKYQVWEKFGFCPPRTTLNQRLAILSGKLDPKAFYGN